MLIGISGRIGSGKDLLANMIINGAFWQARGGLTAEEKSDRSVLKIMLSKIHGSTQEVHIKRWADSLKDIVCMLTGCTREQLEDQNFKNTQLSKEWWSYYDHNEEQLYPYSDRLFKVYGADSNLFTLARPTYREVLQAIGTDMFRNLFHPNTWVNATMNKYQKISGEDRHWAGHAISINEPKGDHYPLWLLPDTRFPNEAKAVKDRGGIMIRINRGVPDLNAHESETALDDYQFDHVIDNNGTIEELYNKALELVNNYKLHEYYAASTGLPR